MCESFVISRTDVFDAHCILTSSTVKHDPLMFSSHFRISVISVDKFSWDKGDFIANDNKTLSYQIHCIIYWILPLYLELENSFQNDRLYRSWNMKRLLLLIPILLCWSQRKGNFRYFCWKFTLTLYFSNLCPIQELPVIIFLKILSINCQFYFDCVYIITILCHSQTSRNNMLV